MISIVRYHPEGAEAVAASLGYKKTGTGRWNGPCPACGGDDRAWVLDSDRFRMAVVLTCSHCESADSLALAWRSRFGSRRDPTYRPAAPIPRSRHAKPSTANDEHAIRTARAAWDAARPCTPDSPPTKHLRARLVIAADALPPAAVRWFPFPAARSLHRTYTDPDGSIRAVESLQLSGSGNRATRPKKTGGREADRKTNGRPGRGVMRFPGSNPDGPVAVCEAMADALAVIRAAGHLLAGAAAMSGSAWDAARIRPTPPPLILLADGDSAGSKAAGRLAAFAPPGAAYIRATLPPGSDCADLAAAGRLHDLRAIIEKALAALPQAKRRAAARRTPPKRPTRRIRASSPDFRRPRHRIG